MEEYEFKKSTCEKYTIRWGNCGWAIFTIDENGLFNCQSDYGDYQHMWPNHGRKSFKHFIIEIANDPYYLLRKVSNETYFDFEKSLKQWKRNIIEMRRECGCNKVQARNVWDFLHTLDEYSGTPTIIQKEIYESDEINDICPCEPWDMFDTVMEYPPGAMYFAKEILPMFAEILKKEIKSEKASA